MKYLVYLNSTTNGAVQCTGEIQQVNKRGRSHITSSVRSTSLFEMNISVNMKRTTRSRFPDTVSLKHLNFSDSQKGSFTLYTELKNTQKYRHKVYRFGENSIVGAQRNAHLEVTFAFQSAS